MSNQKYIRVLFYVTPKFKWKYWVNWLISIRTLSWYSHCEIWTPDENDRFTMAGNNRPMDYWGTCWTSTMRGEDNGTVKRPASGVLDKPEHWEYIEVEMNKVNYDCMLHWMNAEVELNEGYSKWDLLKFVSPLHFPDKDRNICSEFVNNALWWLQKGIKHGIVSPKAVHKKLTKLGYKTKELA